MNTQSTDDDLIRLLKERAPIREPNGLDAAAYVAVRIAEYGSYLLIGVAICIFWIAT